MRPTTIALVVAIGVLAGFYSGWRYSQAHIPASNAAATNAAGANAGAGAANAGGNGGGGGAGGGGFGNALTGPIVAVGNGTITVHDRATNKDVKVALAPAVRVVKTDTGSAADLTKDTQVTVIGQADSSGTVEATAITIGGGAAFFGGGGGRGRPSPAPSG